MSQMSDRAQMKEFFARALPWPNGDEEPRYCSVHWTQIRADGTKGWAGRAAADIGELVSAVNWASKLSDARDMYVCMGGQSSFETKVGRGSGKPYKWAARNQQNITALKSLFIDLDVGKEYPTLKDAYAALGAFLAATGMPRPTLVVGSGGGAHVHWIMSRALTPTEWQPLANALAEATRREGLKVDTQVTVDSARILRPPNTFNYKTDTPRPTRFIGTPLDFDYLPERLEQILEPYKVATSKVTLPPRAPLTPGSNDLAAGIEQHKGPPPKLDIAALECPFFASTLADGGAELPQPLWNLTTLAAVFTEGGRADAHRMAHKHPGYTLASTDELFDRKQREQETKGLGWPSCKAIQNAGCGECATCPHLPEGKGPLAFGTASAVAAVQPAVVPGPPPSDLPQGYTRNVLGQVVQPITDDAGITIYSPVLEYRLEEPWLAKEPVWTLNFVTTIYRDKNVRVAVPFDKVSKDTLHRHLLQQGVVVKTHQQKKTLDFFMSWMATLQNQKDAVRMSAPYGWETTGGKISGFSYGGTIWSSSGNRNAVSPEHALAAQYTPQGNRAVWDEAIRLITVQERPELEAIVAASFAAPLVRFTGHNGAFLSTYSQASGIGKSTALAVALAVWGNPVTSKMALDDTPNAVIGKIARTKSLPLCWDELKKKDDVEKFVSMVFSFTGGKGKGRMSKDATLRTVEQWESLLVSASNESLIEHVALATSTTTAGIMRIFEFDVPGWNKNQALGYEAQRLVGRLNDNYGMIGLEYAQWLGSNSETIDRDVADVMAHFGAKLGLTSEERFWHATISCIYLGAKYANALGFAQFDLPRMELMLATNIMAMRKQVKETHVDLNQTLNVTTILAQYLKSAHHNILWTNQIHISRGKPAKHSVKIIAPADVNRLNGVQIQIGVDDKLMRFSSQHFSDWLAKRGTSRQLFNTALEKQLGAQKVIGILGSGTGIENKFKEYLIQIDLAGSSIVDFDHDIPLDDGAAAPVAEAA